MKAIIYSALLGVSSLLQAQELIINGAWLQKQQIQTISHSAMAWHFAGAGQEIELLSAPSYLSVPLQGDWLEVQTRFNPAGMSRKLSWSHSEQDAAYLLAGQNSRLNGAAMADWRWEPNRAASLPVLVKGKQRIALKPNRVQGVEGWCVLLGHIRSAKPSGTGIANESETRFDWWAQKTDQSRCPQRRSN